MYKIKFYFDKDEEEKWLNNMSNRGWAFEKFFLGFYKFSKCEPGEYIYQIDLLDNWNGDTSDFKSFMNEVGVDVVSQWYRWVYVRKIASQGPFELYTDKESKIIHYSRIRNFFAVALVIEIICFIVELNAALTTGNWFFGLFTVFIGVIILAFSRMIWKCKWIIEQLR